MQLKERFRTMVSVKADDSGTIPSEIQIMPLGAWSSPTHGDFSISPSDAQEFIDNFKKGKFRAGDSLPIDLDHDAGEAAGWIKDLELRTSEASPSENGLYAKVEWTPMGMEKIQSKQYKFFSPEFCPVYMAPQDGSLSSNVLIGGGLVNRPFFKDMKPVTAHERGVTASDEHLSATLFIEPTNPTPMDVKTILAKKPSDITAAEKEFLTVHASELTEGERAAFTIKANSEADASSAAAVATATQAVQYETDAAAHVNDEQKIQDAQVQVTEVTTDPSLSNAGVETFAANIQPGAATQTAETKADGTVTIAAAEKLAMEQRIAAGELAMKELATMKASDKVSGWLFSSTGGKFPPAMKDKLLSLYMSCNETQRASLEAVVSAMPDVRLFGEIGVREAANPQNAAEALTKIADDMVSNALKEGKTLQFNDAWKQVINENPTLSQQYEEQRASSIAAVTNHV